MTYRQYTIRPTTLKRLENRCGGQLRCHHPDCQRRIQAGDEVISRIGLYGRLPNVFHRQCFLDSFINVED